MGVVVALDIGLDGQTPAAQGLDLADHLLGFVVVAAVVDGHVAAFPSQSQGDGGADAETAARNNGVLPFEV